MNIICSIAYSDPPCEQMKDHIAMLVKKQVSSSIRNVKNRGIIGVIRVIDHMVWERKSSDPVDLESSFNTIDSLPTKLARVAATQIGKINQILFYKIKFISNFIELKYKFTDFAITSAQSCPKHLALFFDELASIFIERSKERSGYQINGPFLRWLMTLISEYFEKNFVVDQLPDVSSQWQLEIIRALNTQEEKQQTETESFIPIAINVAGTVLNPSGR